MQIRRKYILISKDEAKLVEMLLLRRAGYSFNFLADTYGVDRSTIRYQCRKYQIFPQKKKFVKNSTEVFNPARIATSVIVKIAPQRVSNWMMVDGERVNTGKSYADYLKANSPYKATA